ncbi:MAG: hypothetical protein KGL74_10505, partial [Elusimicrobia bacterium]|nr:hypothetical protein [Elusimicrobiota bacterium]
MRRAALVLIFLTAAVAARPAPSADLNRRAGRLLRDIRAASLSAAKPVAALRGRLTALTAENAAAPDRDATRRLRLADGNLRLLDAGLPLPPPGPDEVPDPGAALAPPPPSRAPDLPPATFRAAAGAEMPSGARALFDGAETAGADPAPVAARPTGTFAGATLDDYAGVRGDAARRVLLKGAAKRILAGIRRADPGDRAAAFMAERLLGFLSRHRLRAEFSGLSFDVSEGGRLRLSYRLKSGAEGSEDLGNLEDWLSETGGGRGARGVRSKGGGA